jgi:hypothetical protein
MTDTPHAPMPTRTLIKDGEEPLLWIDSLLVLPLGARINLDNIPGGPRWWIGADSPPGAPTASWWASGSGEPWARATSS